MSLIDPTPPTEGKNLQGPASDDDTPQHEVSPWLTLARASYEGSTDWFDANMRRQMERNIDNFHSRHPAGSKYHTSQYANRSRNYRPKTRAGERRSGAAVAKAFFGNSDLVSVEPENEGDPIAKDSALLNKEILEYHLDKNLEWYKTVIAAGQDAYVTGITISRQYWRHEKLAIPDGKTIDGKTGDWVQDFKDIKTHDHPDIRLVPIEYFRFDPGANWRDVVHSSPYIIELMPMHLMDVKRMMMKPGEDEEDIEGKWLYVSDGDLLGAERNTDDPTTRVREERRTDPRGENSKRGHEDHEIVWVHRNTVRALDGIDYIYYTAGTQHMLSKPVPLYAKYQHLSPGERDYVVGMGVIEAHKIYPSSKVQLTENLQSLANTISNQRIDNVQLAMNKRYRIRRGASVDLTALRDSVPGGVYEVENVVDDVAEEQTQDVTGSSYQEQDRVNADFDTLAGQFNTSTLSTNRNLNETVGGIAMLRGDADAMVEFDVTTFALTWAKPVLEQVLKMIQKYETDEKVIQIAGQRASMELLNYPDQQITLDDLFTKDLVLRLRLGTGATDPLSRVNNLRIGMESLGPFIETGQIRLNLPEIAKEVFAAVGYSDSSRFIAQDEEEGPSKEELMAMVQELQQVADKNQVDLQKEEMRNSTTLQKTEMDNKSREAIALQVNELNRQIAEADDRNKRDELKLQRDSLLHEMVKDLGQAQGEAYNPAPGKGGTMARGDYGKLPHATG